MIGSAPLIPENDPSVLFTTAGMHPLIPFLLGERHPAGRRLANYQKCLRTNDIEEVGDATHLTFFEMLGNWSLGDYWKEQAIRLNYTLLTEVFGHDPERLHVTCFAGDEDAPRDDEAAEIWRSLGIPDRRIVFLPKADNWWGPAGTTGPCGPDSEVFFDTNPTGPADETPATNPQRFWEIGNNVFLAYEKRANGSYTPLEQRGSNITTERLRFDFSHTERLTTEQLAAVERIVNEQIARDLPVHWTEMSLDQAKELGALGLFEERYDEAVKVYMIGDVSLEVCGGPHVQRTGELGRFRIVKEQAVAAGVLRIKAVLE